jgi:NADH dehydrogenase FAD-containing subunit
VTLCDRGAHPVRERGRRTSAVVARVLRTKGIAFIGASEVTRVDADGVTLGDGRRLPADLVVWAVGAAGPTLLAESGLPTDARGFLCVRDDLRCAAQPEILAAGDCATLASYPNLPKAGVYAVRQGPVLAANLRLLARGAGRLQVYVPQSRFLSLMNTGDGAAILSYGPVAVRGRWVWRWKDRIDRAFVSRYSRPS